MHPHGVEDLCEAGERVYARALRQGGIGRAEAEEAGCLIELELLRLDPANLERLLPSRPGEVLAGLLGDIRAQVGATEKRMAVAAAAAERFAGLEIGEAPAAGGIRIIEGKERIQEAINEECSRCTVEHVGIQPGGIRPESSLVQALRLVTELGQRGVRVRSLYNHVARHGMGLHAYIEQAGGIPEVRTLDEIPERLVMFDRTVAYIPVVPDRSLALEVRIPAVVEYLHDTFECLWRMAVPYGKPVPSRSEIDGITHRERVIAALLAEGLTDSDVAERLGINVRTCRGHIAKLADVLGSSSRAQLGVRIAQTGLDVPARRAISAPESPTGR
ncbi:DNA-binding response regulator [Streptomyces triticagri]|uniref:DNA-binding response regulator n=1 Tax=Streptomyces triticagri TaxID=2293568 RepID=A0A372LVR1_9ACTN|nr:LuxR C-terminal-related transcriptional regulator [Streptomyces triticagri]RFU82741.1 DNA-binding response regulator [Streptomyces triticagri]